MQNDNMQKLMQSFRGSNIKLWKLRTYDYINVYCFAKGEKTTTLNKLEIISKVHSHSDRDNVHVKLQTISIKP